MSVSLCCREPPSLSQSFSSSARVCGWQSALLRTAPKPQARRNTTTNTEYSLPPTQDTSSTAELAQDWNEAIHGPKHAPDASSPPTHQPCPLAMTCRVSQGLAGGARELSLQGGLTASSEEFHVVRGLNYVRIRGARNEDVVLCSLSVCKRMHATA